MSDNALAPAPQVIAGRYRMERLIARGGMGSVYLGYHLELRRPVAIKILTPGSEVEDGGAFEQRFRLEAETLAALNHPNIVTLYDYGQTEDGRYFLALEYIEGPRYTDIIRSGAIDPPRTIHLIQQVCRALRYAHKRGVVHRDLKPSNLLIRKDDDGEEILKVVDFGLVKVLEDDQSLTRAGLILGSPHCMAPEQIRGLEIDHRADIYAVGILMFRSLTGRWPFHGESSTATMIAHINNAPPTFASAAPDITFPVGLEAIVRRCLEKDPRNRYSDVQELALELKVVLGEPTMDSQSLTLPEPTPAAEPSVVREPENQTAPTRMLMEPTQAAPAPVIPAPPTAAPPPATASADPHRATMLLAVVVGLLLVVLGAVFAYLWFTRSATAPEPAAQPLIEAAPPAAPEPAPAAPAAPPAPAPAASASPAPATARPAPAPAPKAAKASKAEKPAGEERPPEHYEGLPDDL